MADAFDIYDDAAFDTVVPETNQLASSQPASVNPESNLPTASHTEYTGNGQKPASFDVHEQIREPNAPFTPDPAATRAIIISELHWWTSDEDLRKAATAAGVDLSKLLDISFQELKLNGKSRGVAYVEFANEEAAQRLKEKFERTPLEGGQMPQVVYSAPSGNPFRIMPREGAARKLPYAPQHQPVAPLSYAPRGGYAAGGSGYRGGAHTSQGRGGYAGSSGSIPTGPQAMYATAGQQHGYAYAAAPRPAAYQPPNRPSAGESSPKRRKF